MASAKPSEEESRWLRGKYNEMVQDEVRVLLEMIDKMKDNPKDLETALSGYNLNDKKFKTEAVHKVVEHMQNDPENFSAEIKAIFTDLLVVKKNEPEKTPPAKKVHKTKSFVRKLIKRTEECLKLNSPNQR